MTRKFKYRPQYSLLLFGIAGLLSSFYLVPAIGYGEIGFSFLTGLFALSILILTIIFFVLFARQPGLGDLKISESQIEIPVLWMKRITLNFDQIKLVGTTDSWDKVIKVSDGNQIHFIQGNLLDNVDLFELKTILKEKLK